MTFRIAPNGFQSTEIGLIPDDWKIKQAKDISGCIVPGRNKPKKFDGAIPWVTTSDIDELGRINNSKISLFISKEEAHSIGSKVVPSNSVIMSCVGELGVVAVVEDEIVINQQLHAFLPQAKINSKYLSYVLSSLREYFYGKATKTTLPYLNKDNCNSTPIPLPCFEEQTAIANALSDVDALLTELEKLIAKKQAIKTATMQQLLTGKTRLPQYATYTEGEKQGQPKGTKPSELGETPEDWDVKTYGEVFSFLTTASNSRSDLSEEGDIGYIHYGDIHTKWNYSIDMSKTGLPSISNEKVTSAAFLKNGDIVMADASEDYEGIGKSVEIAGIGDKKVISGLHTFLLRDKSNVFSEGFRGYLHSILAVKSIFDRLATGLKVYGLSKSNLKNVPLPVPPKEEQTAIATILSDMDNEIQTLEQRLAKTRQIKQGMMQELLTGRTRLPFEQTEYLEVANAN